jgi:hypothetical protein
MRAAVVESAPGPKAMVTQRFSLDDVDAAYQALNRDQVGRAIVVS